MMYVDPRNNKMMETKLLEKSELLIREHVRTKQRWCATCSGGKWDLATTLLLDLQNHLAGLK